MPIKRKQGENKDDFMSRCIAVEINAGKQTDQAAAICYAAWDEKQLKAIKNIRRKNRKDFAANMPHYTADGKLWTGATHEHNGRLMTGATHTDESEYLYHQKDLSFEKIRVVSESSNVDKMMWIRDDKDPNIGNLVIRFNDGSTYTYKNVDEATFDDVSQGRAKPATTGKNEYGSWNEGIGPSVGAAVHQYLIDKFDYTKGGNFR
jgi:hypothetical protein